MKKKLENAYNPDKQTRKEKVVVGLSGGIDSYVTAYLLKIQKYELFAVTVVNAWDDYPSDSSEILSCHVNQQKIDELKEFCQKMGIPLQVVKATGEFKENVIEPWLADRATGRLPKQCWNCHEERMQIIYNKMVEAGATRMATGHYAKLFHHEAHGSVFVHTSNDEVNDQSALLSRLPHEILSSLILPLSDLSKKEVLKLAENFGVADSNKKVQMHMCLSWGPKLAEVYLKKVPGKFIREGGISTLDPNEVIAEHEGVQGFTPGQEFEYRDNGKQMKGIIASYSFPERRITVVENEHLIREKFLLTKCHFSEEVSWLEPVKGYAVLGQEDAIECWIYPKPLSAAFIELAEPHKVINGQVVSIIKKKGKNSKIYLTGEIQMLPIEPGPEEEEASEPKVNHVIDF